jgi:hypothetical protein
MMPKQGPAVLSLFERRCFFVGGFIAQGFAAASVRVCSRLV